MLPLRYAGQGTQGRLRRCPHECRQEEFQMKGVFAWLIGIPIPIIIVLYLLDVF